VSASERNEFQRMFIGLARGRIERAREALEALPSEDRATEVRRELHTLKGEANLVGLRDIAALAEEAEDLFERGVQARVFDALERVRATIEALAERMK
jgi:HPt (histidine-containing phosphotransfer) domain-containing protein